MGISMVLLFKLLEELDPSNMKKAKSHRWYNCSDRKYGELRMSVPVTARSNCKPKFDLSRSKACSR